MSNSTSVRINVYLTQDVHTKLKHLFRAKGQTIQGGVSTTLAALVAEVVVPEPPQYVPPPRDEPYIEPFDHDGEFVTRLQNQMWLPEAVDEVRALCRSHGIFSWDPPPKLHETYLAQYRERALAAGRDLDKDLESLRPI